MKMRCCRILATQKSSDGQRIIPLLAPIVATSSLLLSYAINGWKVQHTDKAPTPVVMVDKPLFQRIRQQARVAKQFSQQRGFNQSLCFLIEMSVASGQPRMYVYDQVPDTVRNAGLVRHGRCNEDWLEGRL